MSYLKKKVDVRTITIVCTFSWLYRDKSPVLFLLTETYSLSVLVKKDSYLATVKHYRICRLQNGWFYISPSLTFYSLGQLVEHYSGGYKPINRLKCIIIKYVAQFIL